MLQFILDTSSDTQGQIVGARESILNGRKKNGAMKSKERGIFSRPTICPWVSEDATPHVRDILITEWLNEWKPSGLVEPWGPGKEVVL